MGSYQQSVPYGCAACGHQGERPTWLVVDVADRPDLLRELSAGRLGEFPCERCGAQVVRTTSLLVLTGREPLFAADPTADARMTQAQLMASWMYAAGGRPLDRIPGVLPIPHELLPVAVSRDVAADFAAVRAGTWSVDTIVLQRYGHWAADIVRQQEMLRVKDAVGELTQVRDDAEFADLVRRRPELLSDEADALLRAMQDVAEQEAPPEYQRAVAQWRHLLRLCRRDGVERTFGSG